MKLATITYGNTKIEAELNHEGKIQIHEIKTNDGITEIKEVITDKMLFETIATSFNFELEELFDAHIKKASSNKHKKDGINVRYTTDGIQILTITRDTDEITLPVREFDFQTLTWIFEVFDDINDVEIELNKDYKTVFLSERAAQEFIRFVASRLLQTSILIDLFLNGRKLKERMEISPKEVKLELDDGTYELEMVCNVVLFRKR